MGHVATRLLSLILLLQSRSNWKAAELANEFNVSERTIHRYMGMLDEMGIPIYSERGPYGGFSLVRGYKLPPLLFTAEEATVLYMGANLIGELWGQTYEEAVTAATAKLDNVLPDALRHKVDQARRSLAIATLTQRDYRPWDATIHTLRQCIEERHQVRMVYYSSARREHSQRIVSPYGLVLQWGLWYLVAYCHWRQAVRIFRVDRIARTEPLSQGYEIPTGFDVREYVAENMRFEPLHTVAVELDATATTRERERHEHWMRFEEQSDGSSMARFEVNTLDWATGWVLGLGATARVIEPAALIQQVVDAARGALSRYGDPSSSLHEH